MDSAPKVPPIAAGGGVELRYGECWPGCAVYSGAGCAAAAGAEDTGELTTRTLRAGVRDIGAVTGTAAAAAAGAGELAAAGVLAAPFTGLPWLGVTVSTMAAAAPARASRAIAPVIIPLRKLTSSSLALMAARIPGHEPAVR